MGRWKYLTNFHNFFHDAFSARKQQFPQSFVRVEGDPCAVLEPALPKCCGMSRVASKGKAEYLKVSLNSPNRDLRKPLRHNLINPFPVLHHRVEVKGE